MEVVEPARPPESKMVQNIFGDLSSLPFCLTATNFHTYGRAPSPNFSGLTPESWPSVVTAVVARTPAPNPFAARAKTEPSEAVYVPTAPARSAALEAARAAFSATVSRRSFGSPIMPKPVSPTPIAPAIAALRAAASFFDVLDFCGASCGDGVCGDGVCPRGEIDSNRLLGHSRSRPIFLFSFLFFRLLCPRKVTHFFLSDGKNARLRFLKPRLKSEKRVRLPRLKAHKTNMQGAELTPAFFCYSFT
jgi:hypothetical protein